MEMHALRIACGSSDCISCSAEDELTETVMLLNMSWMAESSCKHLSCSEVVPHAWEEAGVLHVIWKIPVLPLPLRDCQLPPWSNVGMKP